jgi:hypothetical protein
MRNYLGAGDGVLKTPAASDKTAAQVYANANAGPRSAAVLRALADAGKQFNSPADAAKEVRAAGARAKLEAKKDKAALARYLSTPTCAAFSDAGNKDKAVSPRDVHALYANEKSLPGTVALLDELEKAGKQADSVPALLAQAKELSEQKRKALGEHLGAAGCPLYTDPSARDKKEDGSPLSVAELVEESEAGTDALPLVQELEQKGDVKVKQTEDLIPLVKNSNKRKPKSGGSASKALEDELAGGQADDQQARDRAALLSYLAGDEVDLLDMAGVGPQDLDVILAECDGAPDAIDQCQYLNKDGRRFASPAELADALKDALPKRQAVQEQVQALLNDPKKKLLGSPVDAGQAAAVYQAAEAGPQTAAELRRLGEDGKTFGSPEEVAAALKTNAAGSRAKAKQEKAAMKSFLEDPQCPLFSPQGNQSKDEVPARAVNDLFRNEHSGPGTAALLDSLPSDNKFDSVPELLAAAKQVSGAKRKELSDHLNGPGTTVFESKDTPRPGQDAVARLAEESEAGPLALPLLKNLEAKGTQVEDSDDLIPLVRAAQAARRPRVVPLAAQALSAGVAEAQQAQREDLEALKNYLASPGVHVLDDAKQVTAEDLVPVFETGGDLENTLAAIKEINDSGESYTDPESLVGGMQERQAKDLEAGQQARSFLADPENNLLGGVELTEEDLQGLGDVGPMEEVPGHLRALAAEGREFGGVDALQDAVREKQRAAAKEKRKAQAALERYLADPSCPLFTDAGNKEKKIGGQEAAQLYEVEGTLDGTGALLNALEEDGKKYDTFPTLLEAAKSLAGQRKKDLQAHLADPAHSVLADPNQALPAELVAAMVRDSGAGPAALEALVLADVVALPVKALVRPVLTVVKAKHAFPRKVGIFFS